MRKWKFLGRVWNTNQEKSITYSGAMMPTPIFHDGKLRIYYTARDFLGCGSVFFIDLDPTNFNKVVEVSTTPVLTKGLPGDFDAHGVVASSVISHGDSFFMYFVGFELSTDIRYKMFTGLAISDKRGRHFVKTSRIPILDRTQGEEFFRCGPYVSKLKDRFEMHYVSGNNWTSIGGKSLPVYSIRKIDSHDGIDWSGVSRLAVDFDPNYEHGVARPWIRQTSLGKEMYFSIRDIKSKTYQLGYAESVDLNTWYRKKSEIESLVDSIPTNIRTSGQMYQVTISVGRYLLTLFNLDDFGASGFYGAYSEND
jgi:hypothetical protein